MYYGRYIRGNYTGVTYIDQWLDRIVDAGWSFSLPCSTGKDGVVLYHGDKEIYIDWYAIDQGVYYVQSIVTGWWIASSGHYFGLPHKYATSIRHREFQEYMDRLLIARHLLN